MSHLTHRQRLQACLAQSPELDRPPVALWRHFPVDDQQPGSLAAAVLDFQSRYDFDLVKLTPASSFSIKDWGAQDAWEGHPEGTRRYTQRVVEKPQDWERLRKLSPSARHLARQLECLRLVKKGLDPETPLLQTIFSPLSQAKNLAGGERLIIHLRQHPEAVLKGLEIIHATTCRFIEACQEVGLDGVFYAIQHAQAGLLTFEEYCKFGLPHDLSLLELAAPLWCNMLHLHGSHVYFKLAGQLPCPIVNWHDRDSGPSLADGLHEFSGVACGGINQDALVLQEPAEIRKAAREAIRQTGGRRFILGTGCVVPVLAPHGNLLAARQSVEDAR